MSLPRYLKDLAADADGFGEILGLIAGTRQQAMQAVNTVLIELYWQVDSIISRKIAAAAWGDGVVKRLAGRIALEHPGLRGFTRPNLFRMRKFYETYRGDEKVSALLRQLPWTHNITILARRRGG
ncbi:DUF1016 N-terminal domain-containing protein [Thauera butanivorans]|uniref:DUF1016 N-terminal domain-containing protein n=1 Tax=Thauera butanivorans TaxID=86174 RepID=UPI003AB4B1BF